MLTGRGRKSKGGIDYWEPGWREQRVQQNKDAYLSLFGGHEVGLIGADALL